MMATDADLRAAFDQIRDRVASLRKQIGRVIVGQDDVIEHLMVSLLCRGHVLIIGVPGLAKTLLVRTLARTLDLSFKRIQFTPDMMPSDILGTELIQEDTSTGRRELTFVPGPVFGQLILADEINRTPPKTQSALLEAMGEQQVTVAGQTRRLDEPFMVVATQNPIEQEGTYPLPEAQQDRFMFSLWMQYPDRDEERRIVAETSRILGEQVDTVFDRDALLSSAEAIERMPASDQVVNYAVDLVRATREDGGDWRHYIEWGAGPRAGQCLVHGAKALAAMEGLPGPGCVHVRRIAPAVLRHRIVLNYAAAADEVHVNDIVSQVINAVDDTPRANNSPTKSER